MIESGIQHVVPSPCSPVDTHGNQRRLLTEGVYLMTAEDKDHVIADAVRRLDNVRVELAVRVHERDTLLEALHQGQFHARGLFYRDGTLRASGGREISWPSVDEVTVVCKAVTELQAENARITTLLSDMGMGHVFR